MDATLERTISTSRIICPEAEPAYGCREATVDHRQMPLVTALGHYQDTIEAPFSAPGHKRGAGASTELRSLLGDDALAADVWMGVGAHDPAQRAAEELAAELVLSCTVEDPVPASQDARGGGSMVVTVAREGLGRDLFAIGIIRREPQDDRLPPYC